MPADEVPLVTEIHKSQISKPEMKKREVKKKTAKINEQEEQYDNPPKKEFITEYMGRLYKVRIVRPFQFPGTAPEYKTHVDEKGIRRTYVRYFSRRRKKWVWVLVQKMIPLSRREIERIKKKKEQHISKLVSKLSYFAKH